MARKVNKKGRVTGQKKKVALQGKKGRVTGQKKTPKRGSKKAQTSVLLDESLRALLEAPIPETRIQSAILRARREQWYDSMFARVNESAATGGKPRGKVKLASTAAPFTKPDAKQIYSEARAFSDGKSLLAWLQNRPFIIRANGYEPFTFAKPLPLVRASDIRKIRALPMVKALPKKERELMVREIIDGFGFGISREISPDDKRAIDALEFLQELPDKERKETAKIIGEGLEAANRGGVFFSVEIDYERPQTRGELSDDSDDDFDFEDVWESAKTRDAKGNNRIIAKRRAVSNRHVIGKSDVH